MKIGVDATPLTEQLTGVGNYVYYLLEELIELAPSHRFFLYRTGKTKSIERFRTFPNVTIRYNSLCAFSEVLWSQTTLAYMCRKDNIDIFWGTTQTLPLLSRKRQQNLLTIYDFTYRLHPRATSPVRGGYMRLFSKKTYRKADCIIPISQGSAARLETLYHTRADAVVIPPLKEGLKAYSQNELQALLDKHQLGYRDYLLMVGTLEPRKNIVATLEAYCSMLKQQELLPLVLVGKKGWRDQVIQEKIQWAQTQHPQKLRLLGYISDRELTQLVSGARFYLMPSLYEGYGMPIAEARVCGTPVICSDIPEMVEAAEGDGVFLSLEQFEKDLARCFTLEKSEPVSTCYPSNKALASILLDQILAISNGK